MRQETPFLFLIHGEVIWERQNCVGGTPKPRLGFLAVRRFTVIKTEAQELQQDILILLSGNFLNTTQYHFSHMTAKNASNTQCL